MYFRVMRLCIDLKKKNGFMHLKQTIYTWQVDYNVGYT